MVARVCRDLGGTSGIVVLNDEAHHCYRDRYDNPEDEGIADKDLTGDDKAEAKQNTEAARLWFTGLRAINEKLGVKAVYDLSATPFFLSGSGYREGTLFPWVVSDFSLIDAIESGIVKIPRVPVDDNATTPDVTLPQPLARHPGRAAEEGPQGGHGHRRTSCLACSKARSTPLRLLREARSPRGRTPTRRSTASRRPSSSSSATTPPSPRWSSTTSPGWEKPLSDDQAVWVPGKLPLFSNVEHGKPVARPRTILVDCQQLESGEGMSPEFKKIAADRDRGVQAPSTPAASPAGRRRTWPTSRSCAR